jgi:ABC-type glycerol-3-phosphate transport system permease component
MKRILVHAAYLFAGLVFILPLWWALASSLRPLDEIYK